MKGDLRLLMAMAVIGALAAFPACKKQEAAPEAAPGTAPTMGGSGPFASGHASELPAAPARPPAEIEWKTPNGWAEKPPASAMRWAQYEIPGDAGAAELVVFYFGPGQGGEAKANVDRWAGQFQQPDGSDSLEKLQTKERKIGDMKVLEARISGTYLDGMAMGANAAESKPGWALVGAIVETEQGNKWFFKLTGPEKTVHDADSGFDELIESLRPAGVSG